MNDIQHGSAGRAADSPLRGPEHLVGRFAADEQERNGKTEED